MSVYLNNNIIFNMKTSSSTHTATLLKSNNSSFAVSLPLQNSWSKQSKEIHQEKLFPAPFAPSPLSFPSLLLLPWRTPKMFVSSPTCDARYPFWSISCHCRRRFKFPSIISLYSKVNLCSFGCSEPMWWEFQVSFACLHV